MKLSDCLGIIPNTPMAIALEVSKAAYRQKVLVPDFDTGTEIAKLKAEIAELREKVDKLCQNQ